MNLWLDDIRDPAQYGHVGWTWVETAEEAIELLKTGAVERASLDHDLTLEASLGTPAPGETNGWTVVRWMAQNNVWPSHGVTVHSLNRDGARRMCGPIARHYDTDPKDIWQPVS